MSFTNNYKNWCKEIIQNQEKLHKRQSQHPGKRFKNTRFSNNEKRTQRRDTAMTSVSFAKVTCT